MRNSRFLICSSLIAVFLFSVKLKGGEYFYYHGKKIPVEVSENKIIMKFKDSITEEQRDAVFEREPVLKQSVTLKSWGKNFHKLQLNQTDNINQVVKQLKLCEEVEIANRVYIYTENKSEVLFGDHFVVQFKPEVLESEIEDLNRENNVKVVTKDALLNCYVLKIPADSKSSLLEVARKYYETFPAEYSMPDFLVEVQLHGDPYFSNQYYLTATHVPQAWDITQGSSAIKIAVIDDGGEIHPDLPAGRIVQGYDALVSYMTGPSDYNPFYDDSNDPVEYSAKNSYHGLACAGIIAATQNNNVGISGIAPNCKIMYVRIYGEGQGINIVYFTLLKIAINYAWQHGADVISNSWGIDYGPDWPGGTDDVRYQAIAEACQNAMTMGRGDGDMVAEPGIDKGCVIVASLGNTGSDSVPNPHLIQCPANVPGVIGVGAININHDDDPWDYSPFGDAVDVVAYSGELSDEFDPQDWGDCGGVTHSRVCPKGNIWTLDRPGQPGRVPGNWNNCLPSPYYGWCEFYYYPPITETPEYDVNYTARFAGTSAACPQVSGLAALILSVNPNLTELQVRDKITSTADDIYVIGFDEATGWGRINTNRAILYTKFNIVNTIVDGSISGTISENTLLRGTITVNNNLTVNAGINLVIEEGSTIKISTGKSIAINGMLYAVGTDLNQITFERNGTTGTWSGITFWSGSSGSLKYCTIQNATNGVYCNGSSPKITNCIFQNNKYGLKLYNCYDTVKSCQINNNSAVGIWCFGNPDFRFVGNHIYNNSSNGVYAASGAFLQLYGNVIENHTNACGIVNVNSSHIHIGVPYTWAGWNTIRNNFNNIQVSSGNPTVEICNSSIHDANTWDIWNAPGNQTIWTDECYWGPSPKFSGTINLENSHYYIPTGWDGQIRTEGSPIGKTAAQLTESFDRTDSAVWIVDPRLPDAEKIKRYKEIISKNPFSEDAKTALIWLYSTIRGDYIEDKLREKKGFFGYLQQIYKNYGNTEIGILALRYMIIWKIIENDNTEVVRLSQEALKVVTGEDRKWVLADLALTYAHCGQIQEAKNMQRELNEAYSLDNELLAIIDDDITDMEGQIAKGLFKPIEKAKSIASQVAVPKEAGISQNYPNPFNPISVIRYQLSDVSNVSLKVYDILGREVATLVDEMKEAGYYTASFDGSKLSSGVYFTRFVVKPLSGRSFVQVKKILLTR